MEKNLNTEIITNIKLKPSLLLLGRSIQAHPPQSFESPLKQPKTKSPHLKNKEQSNPMLPIPKIDFTRKSTQKHLSTSKMRLNSIIEGAHSKNSAR